MATVRLGEVELEYEVRGDGPELVWLHGLSGSLEESRPLCEALSARFRVLWYSTRGHGRSTRPASRAGWTYDSIADDLELMLDHVGFGPPLVAGGSHGANTALRHAIRHPGRARALLLIAPGANALRRPDRVRWALVRGHVRVAQARGEAHLVKALTGVDPRVPDLDADARQKVDAARTHDWPSVLEAMRCIPDQQVVQPASLAGVRVPTTVAAWDNDPVLHPIAVARGVARLLPDAVFVELPRPGDLSPADTHRRVAELATALLTRALPK